MSTSGLWIHELPEDSTRLQNSLATVIATSDNPGLHALASDFNERPSGKITLVFTGQYNAGKSTLIRALTGRDDIVIDSDVATNHVRSYPWGEVLLIDTPGVQAGSAEHDEMAESALRDSDLVVFVTSIDLLDDAAARHLHHVAFELGKRRSLAVVLNKAGMLEADPEIRLTAVERELGADVGDVPIVITDALDHLDADEEADPEIRAELLATGNIAGLIDALNRLVRRSGQESRLRQPFEKVIATCNDALDLLTDDPEEAAARKVLNRQRRIITTSRRRLEVSFDECYLAYQRAMGELGEQLADAIDAADEITRDRDQSVRQSQERFDQDAAALLDDLQSCLASKVEIEARNIEADIHGLETSNPLQFLKAQTHDQPPTPTDAGTHQVRQKTTRDYKQILFTIAAGADKFSARWVPEGAKGIQAFAGSDLHKLVYNTGKLVNKNFRPWEAVGIAAKLGKGAQFIGKAAPFIAVGIDVFTAIQADRNESTYIVEIQARRRRTVSDVENSTTKLLISIRSDMSEALHNFYAPVLSRVEHQQADLDAIVGYRTKTRSALMDISAECRGYLELLDKDGA